MRERTAIAAVGELMANMRDRLSTSADDLGIGDAALDRMAFRWLGGQATRGGSGDVALSAPWGVVRQSAPQTAQGNLRGAYRLDPAGLLRFVRA